MQQSIPLRDSAVTVPRLKPNRRRWLRVLQAVVFMVLALTILATGALAAAYEDPALLQPVGRFTLGPNPGAVPWNGHSPITILIMGVDQRTTESTRSDTMIVLHVDPDANQVTMVSVPRDLWVEIPAPTSYGFYKINAAYAIGQPYGQGPQFAELTVENALHIPINYYAVVKFAGFQRIVDALGGVTVCVPTALYDTSYPADIGSGFQTIDIKKGCQRMDGRTALMYARERHASPSEQDLARIKQQQLIVTGVEKQILSPGNFIKVSRIIASVKSAILTDIPLDSLPTLGLVLAKAKDSHTSHLYINTEGGYVTNAVSSDGQDILQGNWPAISQLVTSHIDTSSWRSENASVQVQNGQHTAGLAAFYMGILHSLGFNAVGTSNALTNRITTNEIIVNDDVPGQGQTATILAQMFEAKTFHQSLGANAPQVSLVLGSTAVNGS